MKNNPNLKILSQGLGTIILVILTIMLLTNPRPNFPLLDDINLLIHQSGHIFFNTFGEFVGVLGGPLMQLLVPLGFIICFKYAKQILAMTFAMFWLGESLINVSIYIKDARTMLLPPAHGELRDWYLILGQMQMLPADQILGNLVRIAGILICLAGAIMAVYFYMKDSKQLSLQNTGKVNNTGNKV